MAGTADTAGAGAATPEPERPPSAPRRVATQSPMMVQYLRIKKDHPDAILFYQMGDFYEMFFDDAVHAAEALDITLTQRGRHGDENVPMCGVPVQTAQTYLARLIRRGFRVAVCEQTEDPKAARQRGSKAVVRREVTRVITPGTLMEDALLDARRHNYLAAFADAAGGHGLAWLDISTGAFFTGPVTMPSLAAAVARIEPGELLVPERLASRPEIAAIRRELGDRLAVLPSASFDSEAARRRLEKMFAVRSLDAFGDFTRAELSAGGAILDYVELTQRGQAPGLQRPRRVGRGAVMDIDPATRRNLELAQTMSGAREGSLLDVIDRTVTGAGARLLAARLSAPLTDIAAIRARHDAVGWFAGQAGMREDMRAALRAVPDMERALSRLLIGRGAPRDLGSLRGGLAAAAGLRPSLAAAGDLPPELAAAMEDLGDHGALLERLDRALGDDLPLSARDGGFIRAGFSGELDEQRNLRDESRTHIAALQARYAEETGIASLKIRHNNVLGYFVDIKPGQAGKVAAAGGDRFIHRQTIASAVRYTTVELGELEGRLAQAGERAVALEVELFEALVADVAARTDAISRAAAALAVLDVSSALAELAARRRYARPEMEDGTSFSVTAGRHPVVEAAPAGTAGANFVANDCDLDEARRLWLMTGPNMAGKSTFLRQNALIAVLAQMGSFVPAETARIGVVDRLFSRVGAADDLARGRSTFMVEMVETAIILNQATERSLVILDEIGRGTATFDGLSIAWATLEHLHDRNRCRTLFATHFHELTSLTEHLPALGCHTMRVKEWEGEVVFLHEVVAGTADRSYGIHVAQLAGLPEAVVARAREVLDALEQGEQSGTLAQLAEDLPLFSAPAQQAPPVPSPAEEALRAVNPDELSPRDALDALYRLKAML